MLIILKINPESVEQLRVQYLKSLPEFQDIILEFLIEDSNYYSINQNNEVVGYVIVSTENILIEFYLQSSESLNRIEIFQQILKELSIKSVLCKSFDYALMKCCLQQSLHYKLMGHLYRNLYPGVEEQLDAKLESRFADYSDLPFLESQEDKVFEPKCRLSEFIESKGILMYSRNEKIVGCGFLTCVHPEFNYYDIGVWTNPDYRKQGIATQIILHLKDTCLENEKIPICGCANGNIASQKTLEKCGFSSRHKLIEFVNQ